MVLYTKYMIFPSIYDEVKRHMNEFMMAGMLGCVGSMDANHITMWMCEHNLCNHDHGGKSKSTTRAYKMTVNHHRGILHSTRGGPGRLNDKMMVIFDTFVDGICDGDYLHVIKFELFEKRGNRQGYIPVKYQGGYITSKQSQIRWSKWVEPIRRGVECTFSILRGHWCMCKTGDRLQGVDAVDKMWLTCCTLHNCLLNIDVLNANWEGCDVCSDWQRDLGNVDIQ
ncbi:hypothetical protein ACHAWX_003721 [Stephanocyclus meneghinianus]